MKSIKNIIAWIVGTAALITTIFFALRKKKPDLSIAPELEALDKKQKNIVDTIDTLRKERKNLKVEDKSLEEEANYWKKQ